MSALATLVGGVLLAVVVAYWGWRAFGPAPAPLPLSETPERWTESIVAAPLFGRSSTTSAIAAQPAAKTLGGDARLLGVLAEADGRGWALFRFADRGPVLVKSGQQIANDVTLEIVRPDGVRIRDHGDTRDIVLRAPPVAAAPPVARAERARLAATRPECALPAGYKGPVYRLNAELLSGIASQPDSWKALLVPGIGGLAVRDESGFAVMLGMKAGDRMAVANGIALDRDRRCIDCGGQAASCEPGRARHRHARRQAGGVAVRERGIVPRLSSSAAREDHCFASCGSHASSSSGASMMPSAAQVSGVSSAPR